MKILVFLLFSLISINTLANPTRPLIHLVHINGIDTSRDEAGQNLVELQKGVTINSNMIEWDLDYNPTNTGFDNMLHSLWDTMQQKANEQQIVSIDDYVNSYMEAHDLHYPVDSPEYNALKSQMLPAYDIAFNKAAGDNFPVLMSNFIESFPPATPNDYSKTEDFFLFIPHSQGNLYANDLWVALTSKYKMPVYRIANYGIASPATSNQGDWIAKALIQGGFKNITSYTTSANDFVMGGLNALYPVLSSTINIPFSSANPLGHNLISTYLSDKGSLNQISSMIDMEAYFLVAVLIGDIPQSSQIYYKLAVQQGLTQTGGGLVSPDGSLLCVNGYCNKDFDYYIAQESQVSSYIDFGKIFLLPVTKFKPGIYTATASNFDEGIMQLKVFFSGNFTTSEVLYDSTFNSCKSEGIGGQTGMFASVMGPWNRLLAYCPQYFMYGMVISAQAQLN